jgi:hypothetical protein
MRSRLFCPTGGTPGAARGGGPYRLGALRGDSVPSRTLVYLESRSRLLDQFERSRDRVPKDDPVWRTRYKSYIPRQPKCDCEIERRDSSVARPWHRAIIDGFWRLRCRQCMMTYRNLARTWLNPSAGRLINVAQPSSRAWRTGRHVAVQNFFYLHGIRGAGLHAVSSGTHWHIQAPITSCH